jgi:hypothetical protein
MCAKFFNFFSGRAEIMGKITVPRAILSPFAETAISQLLPELIQGATTKVAAIRALQRVKTMVTARIVEIRETPAPKKVRRKRSPEEQAKRDAWFAAHRRDGVDEPKQAEFE